MASVQQRVDPGVGEPATRSNVNEMKVSSELLPLRASESRSSPELKQQPAGVVSQEVINSVDLLLIPVGENLGHHLLAGIGVLSEGLQRERGKGQDAISTKRWKKTRETDFLDNDSVGLLLGVVVLLEHLGDLYKLGGRESELLLSNKGARGECELDGGQKSCV